MPDRSTLGDLIVMHGPYEPFAVVPPPVMRFIESDQLNALRAELIQLRDFQTAVMHAVEQLPYRTTAPSATSENCQWCPDGHPKPPEVCEHGLLLMGCTGCWLEHHPGDKLGRATGSKASEGES